MKKTLKTPILRLEYRSSGQDTKRGHLVYKKTPETLTNTKVTEYTSKGRDVEVK